MAILGAAALVSYQRAKADALGYDARGGLMERAERFIVLGFGLLFSGILIPTLMVMFVLTAFTAGQRFVKVWRQASKPVPVTLAPRVKKDRRPPRTSRKSINSARSRQRRSSTS